jgi:hypothetical protein
MGPGGGGDVGGERERGPGHGRGRVEHRRHRGKVPLDPLTGQVGAAEQGQQLLGEPGEAVVAQQPPDGQVAQPDGRVAQAGGQQHVGGHAGGEQPGGHLGGQRLGPVELAQPVDDPMFGVLAAPADPPPLGEVPGRRRLELAQPARRVGQDGVGAQAPGQVVGGQHLVAGGEPVRGQVGDLEQDAPEPDLAQLGRGPGAGGDHHEVDVRGRRELGVGRQPGHRPGQERPCEARDLGGVLGHPPRRDRPGVADLHPVEPAPLRDRRWSAGRRPRGRWLR